MNDEPRLEEVTRPVERLIDKRLTEKRARIERRMKWRQRQWGGFCLSKREAEVMQEEMNLLHTLRAKLVETIEEAHADPAIVTEIRANRKVQVKKTGLQNTISDRLGISREAVSKHLSKAREVMSYLADKDIYAGWEMHMDENGDETWELCAPVVDREDRT